MSTHNILVPDVGDFKDIPVIEVHIKAGDVVAVDDPILTLESDKATMEVPSPLAGVIREVKVAVGDKVTEGGLVAIIEVAATAPVAAPAPAAPPSAPPTPAPVAAPAVAAAVVSLPAAEHHAIPLEEAPAHPDHQAPAIPNPDDTGYRVAHASPSVRKFARELGVDLGKVTGSGPKGRIVHSDVQGYVKGELAKPRGEAAAAPAAAAAAGGLNLLPWPTVDFAKFGTVEVQPLSRIKKISGANLHRNWVMIPHVTQFDQADITDLEAFRKDSNDAAAKQGIKVTMLAFLIKASVAALKQYPQFNASLDGDNLVVKKYFHIGVAVDTPNGLVVPVIRDADQKGILALARELGEISAVARDGKLKPTDMQGGCFSISSLGGIGGTAFTPIINAPEVAILGVSRSSTQPVWHNQQFVPRLMLPLSLSYDHRVIDGAMAARFTSYLAGVLGDIRKLVL